VAPLAFKLWPDLDEQELRREQAEILSKPERNTVFVASNGSRLLGFIEVSIRDWAEGCATQPVGYIEGWYVDPEHRRKGVGRGLVEAAECWAASRGCTEMGSDAEVENRVSQQAHVALGYTEATRVVSFSKKLRV
jgi:aminoglycoside 6'-N-acetyltransferase I